MSEQILYSSPVGLLTKRKLNKKNPHFYKTDYLTLHRKIAKLRTKVIKGSVRLNPALRASRTLERLTANKTLHRQTARAHHDMNNK